VDKLDALLRPRSIAVIGASRTPNTIGYQILDNLLRHGFTGAVYPVNPTAPAVHSVRAYASVAEIPEPVDLAVIVVPKQHVLRVARECGEKGVQTLVVISAGFREVGGEGVERERELLGIVRHYGMRLVGPNCMGILNTAAEVSMNATFAPTMPPAGPVSFLSQSGAMGVTILDYAAEYGIGISQFV
jgi:acetate---CoA ligase (ADP-forming)